MKKSGMQADGGMDTVAQSRFDMRYRSQTQLFEKIDRILSIFVRKKECKGCNFSFPPKRILLVNFGHLGDLVISSQLLPAIKGKYPQAKIGFLVGIWASQVLHGHPDIEWLHWD